MIPLWRIKIHPHQRMKNTTFMNHGSTAGNSLIALIDGINGN
ncbi:hypothetical protein [Dyadobacter tibetensis]|nr:hypothetical protein [Dyadobacter tibetensis]